MTERPSEVNEWPDSQGKMSRRSMMAAAAAMSVQLSAEAAAGHDAIAGLIERAREKNAAFMRGDMDRWLQLVRIAPDFTLMQPFGGPASRGFDASPKRLTDLSRYFREGETELEVSQTYASDSLIVLVMVERQRAEVGGLAAQDWSLRVTEVYRKDGTDWQLVHRHADPLVRRITLQQAAMLARGWLEEK
ncbi:nuclear transport factor 2 family protein [Bradyrhizobium liaoningense]|nr:nuclear transport factor 2 family protein [Bradyrhizobium liaoningense]